MAASGQKRAFKRIRPLTRQLSSQRLRVSAQVLRQCSLHSGPLGHALPVVPHQGRSLGLEVDGGPIAAIHVKGHGRVLMDDSP
jgi:hypothetical protein